MIRRTLTLAATLALILAAVGRFAILAAPPAEAAMPAHPALAASAHESGGSTAGAVPTAEEAGCQRYPDGSDELCALDALYPSTARLAPIRRVDSVARPRRDPRLHKTVLDPGLRPPIPLSDQPAQ